MLIGARTSKTKQKSTDGSSRSFHKKQKSADGSSRDFHNWRPFSKGEIRGKVFEDRLNALKKRIEADKWGSSFEKRAFRDEVADTERLLGDFDAKKEQLRDEDEHKTQLLNNELKKGLAWLDAARATAAALKAEVLEEYFNKYRNPWNAATEKLREEGEDAMTALDKEERNALAEVQLRYRRHHTRLKEAIADIKKHRTYQEGHAATSAQAKNWWDHALEQFFKAKEWEPPRRYTRLRRGGKPLWSQGGDGYQDANDSFWDARRPSVAAAAEVDYSYGGLQLHSSGKRQLQTMGACPTLADLVGSQLRL